MNKISINSILDGGVGNKERVFIRVDMNENIGKYLVMHTIELSQGKISSRPLNFLWLPDIEVKQGDYIFLYTGVAGRDNSFINNNGTMTHVFYWGLTRTIFNNKNDAVVLAKIDDWSYKTKPDAYLPPIK